MDNYARFKNEQKITYEFYTNFTQELTSTICPRNSNFARRTPLLSIFSNIRRNTRCPETRKQFTSMFHHNFIAGPITEASVRDALAREDAMNMQDADSGELLPGGVVCR